MKHLYSILIEMTLEKTRQLVVQSSMIMIHHALFPIQVVLACQPKLPARSNHTECLRLARGELLESRRDQGTLNFKDKMLASSHLLSTLLVWSSAYRYRLTQLGETGMASIPT